MDILHGKIRPIYLRLLGAATGSAMVSSIFGLADAMMVGQYHGPNGVAALAVFSPIWNIIFSLGILAGIGGSILFAAMRGAQDEQHAREYFTLTVLYGTVLSVLAVVGIVGFQDPLLRLFGADDTLLPLAKRYLMSIQFAIPCCVFDNILSAYLRNDGAEGLAMKAVIIGGLFNVVGDYVCIFVLDMGITGAGLATAIGLFVTTLTMATHFFSKRSTLRFTRVTHPLRKLARISATGFPTAISDLSMGVVTVLFNRQIMRYLGVDALSVYGIIAQIVPLAQCCAYGAGQAAQPIVSQNLGARQPERIRECLRYALYTSAALGLLWTGLVEMFPNLFVYLFMTPTEGVLAIAPGIIRTYGVSFLLVPLNIVATYYFQSLMKPQISLVSSLARGFVLSGALILTLPLIAGPDAIWITMPITELLVAAFSVWQMAKQTRLLAK